MSSFQACFYEETSGFTSFAAKREKTSKFPQALQRFVHFILGLKIFENLRAAEFTLPRVRVIMTIECCSWPYLLTKAALFVLSPVSESPPHFSQNFNSLFFKVAGDLPQREDPGISSSVR